MIFLPLWSFNAGIVAFLAVPWWILGNHVSKGCTTPTTIRPLIVACTLNAPGSWHDSYIAEMGKLYEKLKSVYDATGGIAVIDLAFAKK